MSVSIGVRVFNPTTPQDFANNVGTNAGLLLHSLRDLQKDNKSLSEEQQTVLFNLNVFASDKAGLEQPGMPHKFISNGAEYVRSWAEGNIKTFKPIEAEYKRVFGEEGTMLLNTSVARMIPRLEELKDSVSSWQS